MIHVTMQYLEVSGFPKIGRNRSHLLRIEIRARFLARDSAARIRIEFVALVK